MSVFRATAYVAVSMLLVGWDVAICEGNVQPGKSTLRLTIALDATDFLESQPILALICLENPSQQTYRDVVPLEPMMGELRFRLTDLDRGVDVAWKGGRSVHAYSGEGIALPPGSSLCEAVNILRCFGDYDPDFRLSDLAIKEFYLPPGRYALEAVAATRIGWVRDLAKERAQASPIEFTIHPLESDSTEVARLRTYAEECRGRGGSCWNTDSAEEWLHKGIRSRFFYRFFSDLGQRILAISLPEFARELRAAGAGPATVATVIDWRVEVEPQGDRGKLDWLRNLEQAVDGDVERKVLRSWQLRIGQERYYHSYGR
jgi:hypothetical protein